jgi:glycosyltransferase involved in cell wall biosynthesis
MIAFVHPFGLSSVSGGSQILRSLLQDAPADYLSVCCSATAPAPTVIGPEVHVPSRPYLGRIESTRFSKWTCMVDRALSGRFTRRLESLCREKRVSAIHGLAHRLQFFSAFRAARNLGLKYFISVHDDLLYSLAEHPDRFRGEKYLGHVWQEADGRFVISHAMGEEYCRRYGARSFEIITDGVETIPAKPMARSPQSLRIYFMGLFHRSYEPNLRSLLRAVEHFQRVEPAIRVSVRLRCGSLPPSLTSTSQRVSIEVLPMGSQQDVTRDLADADLLYLPLPFDADFELFVRFSMSTKMVSYLGSGLPILYHGPRASAAGELLCKHGAALVANSLEMDDLIPCLQQTVHNLDDTVNQALSLCRSQFSLQGQRRRFWDTILNSASARERHAAAVETGELRRPAVCS